MEDDPSKTKKDEFLTLWSDVIADEDAFSIDNPIWANLIYEYGKLLMDEQLCSINNERVKNDLSRQREKLLAYFDKHLEWRD